MSLSLADYASAKQLDIERLRTLHVTEHRDKEGRGLTFASPTSVRTVRRRPSASVSIWRARTAFAGAPATSPASTA